METRWLPGALPPLSDRTRLFCFPYAGGGASVYSAWRRELSELDVLPVKLPGRESRFREPPITRIDTLVDTLEKALLPFFDSPFALFGHSLGAIVAFELARRAERAGKIPVRLFVSGRESPDLIAPIDDVYRHGDDVLIEAVGRLGATPPEILSNPEIMELFLPVLRADFELIGTYRYDPVPRLTCAVTTLYGVGDGDGYADAEGWAHVTCGEWRAEGYRGDHFFAFGPSRDRVIATIARDLGVRAA